MIVACVEPFRQFCGLTDQGHFLSTRVYTQKEDTNLLLERSTARFRNALRLLLE